MSTEYCEFCQILQDYQNTLNKSSQKIVLSQDKQFFAFEDYDKAAKEHILVCTKKHIETVLKIDQPEKLMRMKQFGLNTLRKISNYSLKQVQKQTRFCFHLPPLISVYHVHLHCFILPFTNKDKERRIFGYLGKSVQQIINILPSKLGSENTQNKGKSVQAQITQSRPLPKL